MHHQVLGSELSQQIKGLCREHDVTLFMLLQSAFAVLLGRYSGEDDIVMGTPIAGRTHHNLEGLIGFFVNSLAIRTDLSDSPDFVSLLKTQRAQILSAYEHQHLPFEMLVESLNPDRSLQYSPLFQIMLIVQNNEQVNVDLEGINLSEVDSKFTSVKYDLELHTIESDEENKIAEIRLIIKGTDLFAKKKCKSFEEATDTAIEALRRQLKKHKEKLKV